MIGIGLMSLWAWVCWWKILVITIIRNVKCDRGNGRMERASLIILNHRGIAAVIIVALWEGTGLE